VTAGASWQSAMAAVAGVNRNAPTAPAAARAPLTTQRLELRRDLDFYDAEGCRLVAFRRVDLSLDWPENVRARP